MRVSDTLIERDIQDSDAGFLYYLLATRSPAACISHRALPTWDQHLAYLEKISNEWPAVKMVCENHSSSPVPVGYYYLTPMYEIGIHTERGKERYHREILEHIMRVHKGKRLLANVAPSNEFHHQLYRGAGFRLVQETYEV